MRRLLIAVILTLLSASSVVAAPQTWIRNYSGSGVRDSLRIVPTPQGFVASSQSVVFTLDASGVPVRARKFNDYISFLSVSPSGDVFVGGGVRGMWAAKLDAGLVPRWIRGYSVPGNAMVEAAAATRDGGLLVSGVSIDEGGFVLRLAPDGALKWSTAIDGAGGDSLRAVAENSDGSCIAGGSGSDAFPLLAKLDSRGKLQWHRTCAGQSGRIYSVMTTASGAVVATGTIGGAAMVMKVGSGGEALWQRAWSVERVEGLTSVEMPAGNFVVAAAMNSGEAVLLLELKPDGSGGWKRRLSPPARFAYDTIHRTVLAAKGSSVVYGMHGRVDLDDLTILALDAASGASSCEWTSDTSGQWTPVKIVGEVFPYESAPLAVTEAPAPAAPAEVAVQSAPAVCSGRSASTNAAPNGQAFRGFDQRKDLLQRYIGLLREKKYDDLDAEAARLRRDNPFADPLWVDIDTFYEALIGTPGVSENEEFEMLRAWISARPSSVAAKLALAKSFTRAASKRRGSSYADRVPGSAWTSYETFLRDAQKLLDQAGKQGESDPQYWVLRVRLDHELDGADVRPIVRRAVAAGHDNPRIFLLAARFLHTKWGGSPAEFLAFIDEVAKLTHATYGEGIYVRLVFNAAIEAAEDWEREYKPRVDWKRMRKGYLDLIALAPAWLPTYHEFAAVARTFNDRATARELFAKPELEYVPGLESLWNRAQYDSVRNWAVTKPAEDFVEPGTKAPPAKSLPAAKLKPAVAPEAQPLVNTPFAQWPAIVMQNEIVLGSTMHGRIGSFLVDTPSGVIAVSVVPGESARDDDNVIRRTWSTLTKWTMWSPGQPKKILTAATLETPSPASYQRGVALTLKPASGTLPVRALKPVSLTRDLNFGRVFVVGCLWSADGKCAQNVVEGRIISGDRDTSKNWRSFTVAFDHAITADAFVGGPVLDEDGYVLGVLKSKSIMSSPQHPHVRDADHLAKVLPGGR